MTNLPPTSVDTFTPGDDTDPGCFTDEEFIEFLTEQGFWTDNLIDDEDEEIGFFSNATEEEMERIEKWLDEKYPEISTDNLTNN